MIVKRFGCTTIHKKRYINASFIHSFIHVESVSCNLQTGSDFPQLASTCSDCKIGGKLRQKLCSVFQA